jgi:hypothetical protein
MTRKEDNLPMPDQEAADSCSEPVNIKYTFPSIYTPGSLIFIE